VRAAAPRTRRPDAGSRLRTNCNRPGRPRQLSAAPDAARPQRDRPVPETCVPPPHRPGREV